MSMQVIPDHGTVLFYARSQDEAGNPQYKPLAIVGWAVDEKTLAASPIVYPALQEGETLVYHSQNGYQEAA
jgi:hypothetical protein